MIKRLISALSGYIDALVYGNTRDPALGCAAVIVVFVATMCLAWTVIF